jgi:hypothetical protein
MGDPKWHADTGGPPGGCTEGIWVTIGAIYATLRNHTGKTEVRYPNEHKNVGAQSKCTEPLNKGISKWCIDKGVPPGGCTEGSLVTIGAIYTTIWNWMGKLEVRYPNESGNEGAQFKCTEPLKKGTP